MPEASSLHRQKKKKKVACVWMETNIALGLFVNSTQLLFRVMGAPPCHNNSLKEEQFNVNNILSICLLMKTFPIHRENVFPVSKKEKQNGGRWTAKITVKGVALAWRNESFLGGTHPSVCLHFSKGCHTFRYLEHFHVIFQAGTPPLCRQLTDLHGHACCKTEAFPPVRLQRFLLRSLICLW